MNKEELFLCAVEAMKNSYAPYSNFNVGAALLCADGTVYKGCNVENASYSATNCAERAAIFSAISDGKKDFKSIMIVGGKGQIIFDYVMPCGICRQVLSEFCNDDFIIYTGISKEQIKEFKLKDLLPCSFTESSLR